MTQPAQQPSASEVLFGGNAPTAAKFDMGVEVGGRVLLVGVHPEREFDALNPGRGDIRRYPSGDVIFGLHVDVQSGRRESADDDGVRRLYIEGQRCKGAVAQSVQAAGAQGVEVGGILYVTKTGKEATPTGVEANTWTARYITPANAALQQAGQPAPQQQQPTQQPAQQGWPASAQQGAAPAFYGGPAEAGGLDQFAPQQATQPGQQQGQGRYNAEQLAALKAAGIDPNTLPQ